MKTIIFIIITGFMFETALANEDKFIVAMTRHIDLVYHATSLSQYQDAINGLMRIADTEKNRWEPYYYAAFGYIMMSTIESEKEKKDLYLDQALASVKKATAIEPQESEILALEGFVHMMRLTVDPASRGPQYSGMAFQSFGTAIKLNPDNPRALILMAQMQYGTAQFFGTSTEEACHTAANAIKKFDSFTPENPLAPVWGKRMAEDFCKQCH